VERLQKVMAHAGVASRRKCEVFIQEGRVKVNGEVVRELGYKVGANDKIEVDGIPIYKEEPVYFIFYKPKGVLSSASDDKGRTVVTDYFKEVEQRVYPVGRLDYDTTGLLLLTNDGEFSNLMTHPKHHIEKKYIAKVKGIPTPRQMRQLERGIVLDGKKTSNARAQILSVDTDKGTGIVTLTIHEGWNHQVKRMFEAVELPVMKLKREEFGFLTLENLRPGDYRELRSFEVQKLRKLALDEK
jgi:pseudouridylate synthase